MNIFLAPTEKFVILLAGSVTPRPVNQTSSGCECLNKIYLGWPIDVLAKNVGFVDGDDDPMLPGRDV